MSTSTPGGRAFPRQSETKRSSLMDARKYDNDDRMDHDTEDDAPERDGWIGVDFAHLVTPPSSRSWVPLVALALLAALGVSALRIDLIRTRYALAETMATEKSMIHCTPASTTRSGGPNCLGPGAWLPADSCSANAA